MTEWVARRFWKTASVGPEGDGHAVTLDNRPIRTPGKAALVLPTRAMADAIAAEWDTQGDVIDPATMPMTRFANTAIDRVAPERAAIEAMLAEYGATDLLCYRADRPAALVGRQTDAWDPMLDWAEARFGARLAVTAGVIPVAQPPQALARLARPLSALSDFRLTAAHDLIALSGSLILGLAVLENHAAPDTIWDLSRLDETWQAEQWGRDDEAEAMAAAKRAAFLDAHRFAHLSSG